MHVEMRIDYRGSHGARSHPTELNIHSGDTADTQRRTGCSVLQSLFTCLARGEPAAFVGNDKFSVMISEEMCFSRAGS